MVHIHKAGGILIQDRKLLFARSQGKTHFIIPGGKLESGETPMQALVRELLEEVSITVKPSDLEPFGTFTAEAAGQAGKTVTMDVFFVRRYTGTIAASNEVEELRWLTSNLPANIEVGSIIAHEVLPRLHEQNLVD